MLLAKFNFTYLQIFGHLGKFKYVPTYFGDLAHISTYFPSFNKCGEFSRDFGIVLGILAWNFVFIFQVKLLSC